MIVENPEVVDKAQHESPRNILIHLCKIDTKISAMNRLLLATILSVAMLYVAAIATSSVALAQNMS
jgi:hypothetical protein